jgi:hypothetical protein
LALLVSRGRIEDGDRRLASRGMAGPMRRRSKLLGLDVQRDTIVLELAEGGAGLETRCLGEMRHEVPKQIKRILERDEAGTVHVAYEAGPTG